jgi:hypothetical protein
MELRDKVLFAWKSCPTGVEKWEKYSAIYENWKMTVIAKDAK